MRSLTLLLIGLIGLASTNLDSQPIVAQPKAKQSALTLLLPLQRKAYQTNELIDISVIRKGTTLAATELTMTVSGDDGSLMKFAFPVTALPESAGIVPSTCI